MAYALAREPGEPPAPVLVRAGVIEDCALQLSSPHAPRRESEARDFQSGLLSRLQERDWAAVCSDQISCEAAVQYKRSQFWHCNRQRDRSNAAASDGLCSWH